MCHHWAVELLMFNFQEYSVYAESKVASREKLEDYLKTVYKGYDILQSALINMHYQGEYAMPIPYSTIIE